MIRGLKRIHNKMMKRLFNIAAIRRLLDLRTITRWVRNPPTQEYVLPMFFRHKPCPFLWLSRKYYSPDLFLYSQYFHPSALTENTMRYNFANYHAQVIPLGSPPHWFDSPPNQSELFPYSKAIEALLDFDFETAPAANGLPAIRRTKEYRKRYKAMLNRAYGLLKAKYGKNAELVSIMDKEKEYILKNYDLSRDERRALDSLRKYKLLNRVKEMKEAGVISEQEAGIVALLKGSKSCYEFYAILINYIQHDHEGSLAKFVDGLGLSRMKPNEKSAMPPEDQFSMKFDELYDVALIEQKLNADSANHEVTANL
eukprot:TRINITY_DN7904_c0_g1_i4.p1 TRINITY_DN7904_c0_g1~~TRINITY_DN7904_c0_g1_i4.p1  ORF type:complete len:312 (+),score=102.44 TRINITY_DN7904_c0_g1_i4:116-1051(+)